MNSKFREVSSLGFGIKLYPFSLSFHFYNSLTLSDRHTRTHIQTERTQLPRKRVSSSGSPSQKSLWKVLRGWLSRARSQSFGGIMVSRVDAEIDEIAQRILSELESASSKDLSEAHYAKMILRLSDVNYTKGYCSRWEVLRLELEVR
jgi:hypothetical protein